MDRRSWCPCSGLRAPRGSPESFPLHHRRACVARAATTTQNVDDTPARGSLMCGIYGRWQRDGSPVSLNDLEAATTQIRHRGPDDEGYLLASVATGQTMQAGGRETDPTLALP